MNLRVLRASGDLGTMEVNFEFFEPTLGMSIDDLSALTDKLDTTNRLLEDIKNGTVDGTPPSGSDSVGDLESAEGALKNDTVAGREHANQIFNGSFEPILDNTSGFLFWVKTIEGLVGVGWLKGILTVSLALGIFGFLCNIVMVAGRSVSRREALAAKSTKGG